MPVEIKELVIRAVVQPDVGARPGATQPATSPDAPPGVGALSEDERAEIVELAVREVLRVLRTSKER